MIHDTTSQLTAMAEDAEVWQIEVNALINKQRLKQLSLHVIRSRISKAVSLSIERNRDKR